MFGYMVFNFAFAAIAFGVHVDKVGSWFGEKAVQEKWKEYYNVTR